MKYGEYMNFGQTLKYYRKERHISQEDLSCGICDRKYVSNVENNKCIPSLYMVYLLSEKLNIDLFSKYAQTMRHKNIETHRLIEKISDSLRAEKTISEILPLLDCCKELEDFKLRICCILSLRKKRVQDSTELSSKRTVSPL